MAGTWLPKGTRERLSAHRGVTVAKSQTHALYTIRVLLMKSAPRSQVAAARQRSDMSSLLCPSRGADTFYCSFVLHLDFPLGTSAIPEVVAGFLPSLPFSPWTPIPLHPSFPLFLKTLLVCLTHAAEAEPLSRFSIRTRCSEGKLRGCCCHFTCNTTPTRSPLSVEPPRHKSCMVFRWIHCSRCSSPVVIFETVDLIFRVHGEGHSVKALVTDDTAEAAWVVGLPQGL